MVESHFVNYPQNTRARFKLQSPRHLLADANFPVSSVSRALGARELREDGHSISDLLEAILKFFPLDAYVDKPVAVMDPTPSDKAKGVKVTIWNDYKKIIGKHEAGKANFDVVERFAFYERAKRAYAVVQTGVVRVCGLGGEPFTVAADPIKAT
uniref:L-fucose mutarotase n=1 Tax=Timema poppense TaxID=170557 RepID=A0A7R9GUL8_TIMPO|nr:unnamed protein product [Timema poppensis]